MSDKEKPHTRFVVGGVYQRKLHDGVLIGTITSAKLTNKGRKMGYMSQHGYPPDAVVEDTESLDKWELVAEPVPCDVLRQLEELVSMAAARRSKAVNRQEPHVDVAAALAGAEARKVG